MAAELTHCEEREHTCGLPVAESWSSASEAIPLDFEGPVDIIFERFEDAWIERPIMARFEQIAVRHAERVAVDDGTTRMTYRMLRRSVYSLALRIEAVAPPGRPVGILLPHNAFFPLAALACLAIGRPYVPIDLKHPAARIDEIIREANLAAIILNAGTDTARLVSSALAQIDIATALAATDEPDMATLSTLPIVDCPAVILYTSGSTGKPKGICNSQRGILQRVAASANSCHVHADDRIILLSSSGTIAGVRETFTALLNGASLHIADPHESGLGGVLQTLREGRITLCYTVPALLRTLLRAPSAKEAFANLRIMRIAGDITLESDFALCRSIVPASCHFFSSFSSTEMPTAFQWFVPSDWQADGARLPVGYARPGISFMLAGEDGMPVVPGETGELIVRSRYLALGQWQDGRLQAGSFLCDPEDPSMRILRTGDMMKLLPDGLWELIGRKDRQIKIRGQRVDPGEVEAALRSCADVSEAAVIARRNGEEVIALVAYVVPRASADAGLADALKDVLTAGVPRHMHPADIRLLAAIPQLPGFKTDIGALEKFDRDALAQQVAAAPKETDGADRGGQGMLGLIGSPAIRDAVKYAWTAVLGARSFEINQPWDHTNGDSLKAMELWFHIEQTLGRKISLDALDESTTPSELVNAIERHLDMLSRSLVGVDTGAAPLVFLMPGILGDEPLLAQFRAAFGNRVRFKVIDYPEGRHTANTDGGFESIVDAAFVQICTEQPACETYCLAGYSFGGYVAFETARRLMASGRHVAFLGLIDSRMSQTAPLTGSGRYRAMLMQIKHYIGLLAEPVTLALWLRKCWFELQRAITWIAASRPATAIAFTFHQERNYRQRKEALHQWTLKPLDITATLFLSDERLPDAPPDYGWGDLCKELAMVCIGGSHYTMMEPPRLELLCARFLEALHVGSGLIQMRSQKSFTARLSQRLSRMS